MSVLNNSATDFDRLMRANLVKVFNEREPAKRFGAISELYCEDAMLYEPPDTAAKGYAAISAAVTRLLASLPPDFEFTATGPAIGHHGLGRLHWRAGPPSGPIAVTGMDIARFENGRIHSLHVFIEPTA